MSLPALQAARGRRGAQRGTSLMFALITLAAMSLAAVALVRSVDTASLLAGNLGFKQASVAVTGQAAEAAIERLTVLRATAKLGGVEALEAYYPIAYPNLDPTNKRTADGTRVVVDWADDGCAYAGGVFNACIESRAIATVAGNTARYVITRLCNGSGDPTAVGNSCAKPINSTFNEGLGRGGLGYPSGRGGAVIDPGPFYRIVVRTIGARNTITYAETIVHF